MIPAFDLASTTPPRTITAHDAIAARAAFEQRFEYNSLSASLALDSAEKWIYLRLVREKKGELTYREELERLQAG